MDSEQIKEIIQKKQKGIRLPYSLTFELSPLCNFNCKMCYVHRDLKKNESLIPYTQWIDIAKEACDAGVLQLTLTGGEVFLFPHFRELYETIYDMGFYISILSNAYLINDNDVEWLSKRKPYLIKSTIYGASNETYHNVCGVRDGFDRVTANLLKLKNAEINVMTSMTIIQENKNDVPLVKQWAEEHEIAFFSGEGIRQSVRGAQRDINAHRIAPQITDDKKSPLKEERKLYPYINGKPFSCCKSYRNQAVVTWQGNLLGCTFVNSIYEKYSKGELVNCYRRLWDRLDQIKQPSKCDNCKYLEWCNPCPGNIEGESGCLSVAPQYICDVAKYNYYALNYTNTDMPESNLCD